jgi:hypothetical protein
MAHGQWSTAQRGATALWTRGCGSCEDPPRYNNGMRHNILTKVKPENIIGTEAWKRKQANRSGRRRPKCPAIVDGLLGEIPDGLLALFLDVPVGRVTYWRLDILGRRKPARVAGPARRRGRPRSTVPYSIRVEADHPGLAARLGREHDSVIAAAFGLACSSVGAIRRRLSISAYRQVRAVLPSECLERLGQDPDAALAREYDVPAYRVSAARKDRGIAAGWRSSGWQQKADGLFGTMSDRALGRIVGVTDTTIHRHRVRLGIPPFKALSRWSPIDRAVVAKRVQEGWSDSRIAESMGAALSSIANIRRAQAREAKDCTSAL